MKSYNTRAAVSALVTLAVALLWMNLEFAQVRGRIVSLDNVEFDPADHAAKGVVLLVQDGTDRDLDDAYIDALNGNDYTVVSLTTPDIVRRMTRAPGMCREPYDVLSGIAAAVLGPRAAGAAAPIVVGRGRGASLAAAIARSTDPDLHAVVTVDYCPHALVVPGCEAVLDRRFGSLSIPWFVLSHHGVDARCRAAALEDDIQGLDEAKLTWIAPSRLPGPNAPREFNAIMQWLDPRISHQAQTDGVLEGIPVIERRARAPVAVAVFLSGDGGWADLDRSVSALLVKRHISVVGWDSLSYFWRSRSPREMSADLNRLLLYYRDEWEISRFILVGYSLGANVLPFAVNRLPPATRALVAGIVLLGPSTRTNFEFHLDEWLGETSADTYDVAPEITGLAPTRTLCIQGATDKDAYCPSLAAPSADLVLPGDHHFNGDYPHLAALIAQTFGID